MSLPSPAQVFKPFNSVDRALTPVYKAVPALAPQGSTGLGTTENPIGPQRGAGYPTLQQQQAATITLPALQSNAANTSIVTNANAGDDVFNKAAKASGDSGLSLDPLGRRGKGVASRSTILGK